MKNINRRTIGHIVIFVALLWLLPSVGEAADRTIDCDAGATIGAVIRRLEWGDILLVSGTCNGNVDITGRSDGISLDGQGTATINGTVRIEAQGVTIKGFTITGGSDGIAITRGATVVVDGNNIQNVVGRGISVSQHSFAQIINNTIQNNTRDGIGIQESSSARIGFLFGSDTTARPNTIQNNGNDGIQVQRSSNARIVGNNISNNGDDGVEVRLGSHADISDNDIDGNADEGIRVNQSSGVNLGSDTGTGIFDLPNRTDAANLNGDNGIRGFTRCYVNGRLGSLNGTNAAKNISGSCSDNLI